MRYARNSVTGALEYPTLGQLRRMRGAEVPPEVPGSNGDLIPSELASDEYVDAASEWKPVDHVSRQARLLDDYDPTAGSSRDRRRREERAARGEPEPEPRPARQGYLMPEQFPDGSF
jgi:hypothetical protein